MRGALPQHAGHRGKCRDRDRETPPVDDDRRGAPFECDPGYTQSEIRRDADEEKVERHADLPLQADAASASFTVGAVAEENDPRPIQRSDQLHQ